MQRKPATPSGTWKEVKLKKKVEKTSNPMLRYQRTVTIRAVVTPQPNWPEIYSGETITLTCDIKDGGDAEWEYEWRTTSSYTPLNPSGSMIRPSLSGDYWCNGRLKDEPSLAAWSDSFTIKPGWRFFWYKAVPKLSDDSYISELLPGSTDDAGDPAASSAFPVLLVVGLLCGVLLIILLLLFLYRCRKSTDSSVMRSQSTNQRPATDHMINQVETQDGHYASLLHGDAVLYETMRGSKEPEHGTSNEPEDSVYSNVTMGTAAGGGGVYWCRGGRGDLVYYSEYSDPVAKELNRTVTIRAVVTQQPNWPEIYSGEMITLTCEVKGGGDAEWEYKWGTTSSYTPLNPSGSMIRPSLSGDYWCKGRLKDKTSSTDQSYNFTIKPDKPHSVLTVSPLWLRPGDSVTLTCSVKHPSAGWRFFWYKAVPKLSDDSYISELLPGSTDGTEHDSYIVHGQTHTAGYVCRAGRGDPVFYTQYSKPKFVWSGDLHPAASLSVSPDRVQHFNKDSLSLSCEGNSTEWRVSRFYGYGYVSHCSVWGTMTGSTCNMNRHWKSGVFWCESETQFSNAANITIQNGDVILVSPVRPVTEGHSVTLGCKLKTENVLHDVDFYRNEKLIPNQTRGELNISAVTKSDEGFYKCRGRNSTQGLNLTSAESWLSVKYSGDTAASSAFPVLLVVGLLCGVLLIILLLLFLYRCRKSTDSSVMRSQSTNQRPATDHMINQVETQDGHYASLLHGDAVLYETMRGSKEPEHGTSNEPEESVYSNVTVGTAAERPKARLSKDSPVGDRVILTCSVGSSSSSSSSSSSGWKYFWYRSNKTSEPLNTPDGTVLSTGQIRVSGGGGVYWCRGGRGDPVYYTEYSDPVVTHRAVVTQQPNWPEIYSGETITLTCEIKDGGDAEWEYEWRTPRSYTPLNPSGSMIRPSLSGDYWCKGRLKDKPSSTEWKRPKARLSLYSVGGRVTLTCSVGSSSLSSSSSSSGWKYFWYRSNKTSEPLNTPDGTVLPTGRISVSGGGGVYWCRGGRGDPVYYTEYSDPVVTHRAVVTQQHNWPEIYSGETITLTCEVKDGGDAEWEYKWRTPSSYTPLNPSGSMIRSSLSGHYWCKGRLKDEPSLAAWSDSFTIKPDKPQPVLTVSPLWLRPGDSVTLTCSVKHPSAGWRFFWYKFVPKLSDDSYISELLPGSTDGTEQDSYIVHEQTHTAGYVCRAGRGDPVFYTQYSETKLVWSGDAGDTAASSAFPVLLVVGLLCGVLLIILLLLFLYRCRKSTDSSVMRSQSTNQRPATDHMINQVETQDGHYASLLHGDAVLYETIRGSKEPEHGTSNEPEESVYSNVTMGTAAGGGGVYWCRGGRGDLVYYSEYSDPVGTVTIRAVVTQQPNWPEIYSGEMITLTCEVKDGGDAEWEYKWGTTSSYTPLNPSGSMIRPSLSGDYWCKGRLKDKTSSTDQSYNFTIKPDKPHSVLTVSPLWLRPGDSVTLTCSVKHPSAGWRFFWYKAVPKLSDDSYISELLPGSIDGTEHDSYIVHGQTHTAGYVCRAGRGDPVFYTQYSKPKFVWSGDLHPAASLSVSPDRVQHFNKDSLSLSCEGNSTEWRVSRFYGYGYVSHCSVWGTMTGSTCNMNRHWKSGVFWCESETQFSNAANITIQNGDVILVSPVRPVTEGHSVTLGCKLKTENVLHDVDFYRNEKLIPNQTRGELNISAVTKSDEGFYKCRGRNSTQGLNLTSAESWLSVKYSGDTAASSAFPVLLVVGLLCGVLLIILLLLFLYRCRKSTDSSVMRSQSTNQRPATDHMINQVETQDGHYASLLHGDAVLYETMRGSKEPEHGTSNEPEESVYSNVTMGTAADQ
ncbi:uncharacterized protein LOC142950639 [Anarhichas minor]|uniref:uncharacterized protein LOC142950639 n=1 Tax=Anarhichas minor TaxID=65739 RepID=UPI003F73423A